MIYPKCLYKSKTLTRVAKDEKEHRFMASNGWKDMWTDKEPNKFIDEIKEELRQLKLKAAKEELEAEEAKKIADKANEKVDKEEAEAKVAKRAVEEKKKQMRKNGNRKNTSKGSIKTS